MENKETSPEFPDIWGYTLGDPVIQVRPNEITEGRVGHALSFNGTYVTVRWENGDPDTVGVPSSFTKMPTDFLTAIYKQLHKMAGPLDSTE